MIIKPLSNTITLSTANTVYNATAVHIANDGTARTITVSNTAIDTGTGHYGNYVGGQVSFRLNANETVVVRKRPYDRVSTSSGSGVYVTKVTESGT